MTKVRAEYIKLRGAGWLGKTGIAQTQPKTVTAAMGKEDLKKLEKEVLGDSGEWVVDDEEEEDKEEGYNDDGDDVHSNEREEVVGDGEDDEARRQRRRRRRGGNRRQGGDSSELDLDGDDAIPPWAKEISDDVDKHIKEGKAPPILRANETVRKAIILPSSSSEELPESPDDVGKSGSPLFVRRGSQGKSRAWLSPTQH